MPTQSQSPQRPQQPQQTQHPRPWWKDIRLGIFLLVMILGGAGVFLYLQKSSDRKPQHTQTRPRPVKEEAPGCNIEGILLAQDGPAVVINGNIYSLGDSVCGGTITRMTPDAVTIESRGREQVFSMNVPVELTTLEKTKIRTQKNIEILTKAAGNTFGAQKKEPTAVKQTETPPQSQPAAPKPERAETPSASSQTAKAKKVEIFITDWCPHCRQLETFLTSKNIAYQKHDIEKDYAGQKKYKSLGGDGVPLILIGSKVIQGFDPFVIEAELKR